LEDADVLIDTEVAAVNTARLAYNATIKAEADADPDLLLFDAAAKLTELNTTGILYGSGGISSAFIQGGGFSLDGVHPTARGYAVIANEIMKVIENAFGANLPPVDPSDYTTVFYQ
jgi:lysophospholipase L1-like esterase